MLTVGESYYGTEQMDSAPLQGASLRGNDGLLRDTGVGMTAHNAALDRSKWFEPD